MSSDPTGSRRADLARDAADAAMSTAGVTRLDSGALGEFATYADGERVGGVRISSDDPSAVRLRLVVAYGRPIPDIAADVDAAVRDRLGPRWRPTRVDIEVVDVDTRVPEHDDDEGTRVDIEVVDVDTRVPEHDDDEGSPRSGRRSSISSLLSRFRG